MQSEDPDIGTRAHDYTEARGKRRCLRSTQRWDMPAVEGSRPHRRILQEHLPRPPEWHHGIHRPLSGWQRSLRDMVAQSGDGAPSTAIDLDLCAPRG